MSFRVIKGTFHIKGYSPDGDSVRFLADDPAKWLLLGGRKVRLNSKDHAQLRIEAIDTLETHYENQHQPPEFALAAADHLFELLGIKNVVWNATGSRVKSADDGTSGFIVSRTTERYGRPISFVFNDAAGFTDGQELFVNKTVARKSVNFKMLSKGLAYPTFYDGMFYDLRELFAAETQKARKNKTGVWSQDTSNKYFAVKQLSDVTEEHVILPKLFRRITAYLKTNTEFDPTAFLKWLQKDPEKVLILSILHFTHFDNLIEVNDQGRMRLKQEPENVVFLS